MFAQGGQLIGEEQIKRILNLQRNRYLQAFDLKELVIREVPTFSQEGV